MKNAINKIIIIGSGPAGYTAALYTARAALEPLVFTGLEPGGQLNTTTEVENFPGFPEGILGPDLMDKFKAQARRFGARIIDSKVDKVDFLSRPFKIWSQNKEYQAEAVVVATGASAVWLGLESESRLRGKGVSSCATCDGFFFKGKELVLVGGGDVAMEDAVFLTKFAAKVTIVHRREELRASKIMQERARKNSKIEFIFNTEVVEILGTNRVEGVRIKNNKTNEEKEIFVGGVFIAIGHKPNTEIFKGQLELDKKNYLVVKDGSRTNIEGVFAGGDAHDHTYRQAVTAAGFGCMAAIDAERWLEGRGK